MAAAAEQRVKDKLPEGFHENSVVKQIRLAELKVDRDYQRDVSMRLVDDIAYNWDEVASELVLVSNRGDRDDDSGGFYIVNGQHRSTAARKLGLEKIWARIIDLTEHPDPAALEAGLRLKTNVRLGDRPLERFKAQLRSGDEESLAIQKLLLEFDTEVNEQPNMESGINSVSGLETLYRVDDGGLLREVLQVIKEAYGMVGGKTSTLNLMKGIAWFILKHADETDRNRFVDKLKLVGPAALDRRARTIQSTMGGSLWLNYYRAMVDFYNEKLADKSRLEWRVRSAGTFTTKRSDLGNKSWSGRVSS